MSGMVVGETPDGEPSEILHSVAALAAMVSHEINNPLMTIVAKESLINKDSNDRA
jgi:nitrogen-specific signal transduction histidine kinase